MKTKLAVIVLLVICTSCGTNDKSVPDSEKIVMHNEPSKNLNQVDLWQKFSGTWKGEIAKDTFIMYEERPYGTGMENKIRIITRDKILQEGIGLFGYDRESDKIIETTLLNGDDIICNAFCLHPKTHVKEFLLKIFTILKILI